MYSSFFLPQRFNHVVPCRESDGSTNAIPDTRPNGDRGSVITQNVVFGWRGERFCSRPGHGIYLCWRISHQELWLRGCLCPPSCGIDRTIDAAAGTWSYTRCV